MTTTQQLCIPEEIKDRVKIDPDTGCWLWQGYRVKGLYGRGGAFGRHGLMHRLVYEELIGPIENELDHVRERGCIYKHCCNPAHMEDVTHQENVRRDHAVIVVQIATTHCPQGHPYVGDNLKVGTDGKRYCRECHRADGRRRYAEKGRSDRKKVS